MQFQCFLCRGSCTFKILLLQHFCGVLKQPGLAPASIDL